MCIRDRVSRTAHSAASQTHTKASAGLSYPTDKVRTCLPIAVAIVVGMSVGTLLLRVQLITRVVHLSTVVAHKFTIIHVVAQWRVRPIIRIKLAVPKHTRSMSSSNQLIHCSLQATSFATYTTHQYSLFHYYGITHELQRTFMTLSTSIGYCMSL